MEKNKNLFDVNTNILTSVLKIRVLSNAQILTDTVSLKKEKKENI